MSDKELHSSQAGDVLKLSNLNDFNDLIRDLV